MPIINRIAEFHEQMTAWRRDLHAHPELGFEEQRTAAFVARELESYGIEVHRGIATTGVVGVLRGDGAANGKVGAIGLRADMDALPMQELNTFAHASKNAGKMHACGHDGHTTMLLGAAKYLAETRNFSGTVNFIFQPAEEGLGGGKVMLEEGLLDRFPCDEIYGLHNWPQLPQGEMGMIPGPIMAASDTFDIEIITKGGHAAMPHHSIDPAVIAAHIITATQTIASRRVDPLDNVVVSITRVEVGSAYNVIAAGGWLRGTFRTFREDTRRMTGGLIASIAEQVAGALGGKAIPDIHYRYPPTVNTIEQTAFAADVARELVGEQRLRTDVLPSMGGEDFSYMLEQKPGCYVWLGAGVGDEPVNVHHPAYDFNDKILPIGSSYLARLVETAMPRS